MLPVDGDEAEDIYYELPSYSDDVVTVATDRAND